MFKCLNIQDGTEIIILAPKWLRDVENLRVLARQDALICQGCNHPVGVRAGEERRRRPHFAHKNLGDCCYVEESQAIRNARAVLYEWLVGKFGDNVTIEKKIDSVDFPRPVDCWVKKDSKTFAYWIFDKGLKLEKRMQLFESSMQLKVSVNYIFFIDMLRKDDNHPDSILLTTTEREFLSRSDYDLGKGNTLHYLDPEIRKITTFRGLRLVHQPQVYSGYKITSDLEETQVSPKNGEFVHKGEHERVQQHREELASVERRRKKAEIRIQYFPSPQKPEFHPTTATVTRPRDSGQYQDTPSISSLEKNGICVSCGNQTTDWFTHWVEDGIGKCKCNSCMRQGKFG